MRRADNITAFMCLLEPSVPVQACNGIALPLHNFYEKPTRSSAAATTSQTDGRGLHLGRLLDFVKHADIQSASGPSLL